MNSISFISWNRRLINFSKLRVFWFSFLLESVLETLQLHLSSLRGSIWEAIQSRLSLSFGQNAFVTRVSSSSANTCCLLCHHEYHLTKMRAVLVWAPWMFVFVTNMRYHSIVTSTPQDIFIPSVVNPLCLPSPMKHRSKKSRFDSEKAAD